MSLKWVYMTEWTSNDLELHISPCPKEIVSFKAYPIIKDYPVFTGDNLKEIVVNGTNNAVAASKSNKLLSMVINNPVAASKSS